MPTGVKTNKVAINWRIEDITDDVPELSMLVNPQNLDLAYAQIINETRTLGGFLQEYWGEELTTLSASGFTGMFYDGSGLTNRNSRTSEAYQNYVRLVNIYKNNGKVYRSRGASDLAAKANPDKIVSVGLIVMTYFNKEYEGFFESFNTKENANNPFLLEYDFSFKVTKIRGDFLIEGGNYI